MKRKLLLAALFVVGALGFNANAQTDVTATYLVNPGFEILKASDGETDVTVKTTLSGGLYGWEVAEMSNYQVESQASGSGSGFVNGNGVAPSEGTYYYFNCQGWSDKNSELKTTTKEAVAVGKYYLVFDYKAADYSNNNNASKNGTAMGIKVIDADENELAVVAPAKRAYSIANGGSNPGVDSYIYTAQWTKMGIYFEVTEASVLTFAVQQNMKNSGRSDILYDNFKLYKIDDATNVDFTALIVNPACAALNANGWENGRTGKDQQYDGAPNNVYLDTWNETLDQKQSFFLPVGSYTLKCATRAQSDIEEANIYVNKESVNLNSTDVHKDGNSGGELGNGWGWTEVPFLVNEAGNVTIGFYSECGGSKWAGADNFTLTYNGQTVGQQAVALPSDGAIAADTWYYFDVDDALAGDNAISATTLEDVVYTTNGDDMPADVVGPFAAADADLVANRYYIKSASAQTFTIGRDATNYITNPELNTVEGWTFEKTVNGNGPSYGGVAMEYWSYTAGEGGFDFYQTITGLPNGKYVVSAEMFNGQVHKAGDTFKPAAGVYGTSMGLTEFGLVTTLSEGAETAKRYSTDVINVLDGTLRLGVKNQTQEMPARWFYADNFKLTFVGAADFYAVYQAVLADATAIDQEKKMAPSILAALQNAIATYGTYTEAKTDDELLGAINALQAVIKDVQTSIASYEIIASGTVSTSSLDGWTCTNTNDFVINTWSTEAGPNLNGDTRSEYDPSNMVVPFIQNWVAKGSYLGEGTFSYTLEGLEPGEVYYAQALIRSYNEKDANVPNGPNFFIRGTESVETDLVDAGTPFTYSGMSGIYATLGGTATVGDDGKLTLGAVIAADANYNWVAFKNVSIRPLGDAYNAAIADAKALEGTIPAAAYTAMMNTIENDYSAVTVDNILAINGLVTTYSELVAPYAEFYEVDAVVQALYNVDSYEELVDGAHATLGTAITTAADDVEEATTVDGINQVNATLKAAGITYAGAANPTGTAKFDLTFMLTNPDLSVFTSNGPQAGWYTDQTFQTQNSQVMQSNADVANSEDDTKFAMYEYWSEASCATSGYTVYTKVTLPTGTYQMDALCMAGWGYAASSPDGTRNITFSAGDVDGTQITTTTLEAATLDFVQAAAGEVKIGLKAHEGNTCNWMGIGYVELYKIPAKAYTVSESVAYDATQSGAGKVELTRTIKEGVNTLVLPFGMTQAEVEATFGAGSKVYVVSEFDGESNVKFAVQDGIVANVPCVLKATVASGATPYEIEGRTLVATAEAPVKTVNGLSMVGTYAESTEVPADGTCSIVADGKFYLVDSDGVTVAGTRAYFQVANGGGAIKALNFIFEDEEGATAIAGIGAKKAANAATYNVAGQRVGAAYKGIVIKDGKKYYQK